MKTEKKFMSAKALTKSLVTVHTVRAANGRIMSLSSGVATAPAVRSPHVTSKIRNVADAARFAMQSLNKK